MTITEGSAIADEDAYVGVVYAHADEGKSITLTEQNGGVFVIPSNVTTYKAASGDEPASGIDASIAEDLGYEVSGTAEGSAITPSAEKESKSYYVIDSSSALTQFVSKWNGGDEAIQSVKQIKFATDVTYDYTTTAWTPLGTWEYPFNGVVDGMGCTIKGMGIIQNASDGTQNTSGSSTGITGQCYGFIGIAGDGDVTVTDINFADLNIKHNNGNMIGAVIGFAPSQPKFAKVDDDGYKATNSDKYPGGKWKDSTTVGYYDVTISNITVSGAIEGKECVSSIIGKAYNYGNITITNCTNNARITMTQDGAKMGGIAGYIAFGTGAETTCTIENCVNNGELTNNSTKTSSATAAITTFGVNTAMNTNKFVFKNNANNGNIVVTNAAKNVALIATTANNYGPVTDAANATGSSSLDLTLSGNTSKSTATITVNGTKVTNAVLVNAECCAYDAPNYGEASTKVYSK